MSTVVGDIRPSQLLWSYGPGSLIDLPNLSVTLMGLGHWNKPKCTRIEEARLLEVVRNYLGNQVGELIKPPVIENDNVEPLSPEAKIGVPVRSFPRTLRCVRCGLLGNLEQGHFDLKERPYRPDQTHYVHSTCVHGGKSDAVPARFLLACKNGHLDDFPWHWYVHGGPSPCTGILRFYEGEASLQTENLWVKCEGCKKARSLVHAFGREAAKNLPKCRGRHPHLGSHYENCDEAARTVLLGASNSWFPVSVSVLAIPMKGDLLTQIIADAWEQFNIVEERAELSLLIKQFKRDGAHPGIEKYSLDEIWDAIVKKRSGGDGRGEVKEIDVKRPEWDVLTSPNPPKDWPYFLSEKTTTPTSYKKYIQEVLLLKRLREVNALIGFTRVEAPEESLDPEERPPMAPLDSQNPKWVPANEVHGEGIFLRFHESLIQSWEQGAGPKDRDKRLLGGHTAWREMRKLDPSKGYPSVRYAMLHTFSHLLIRELALECGYNAASIRERIYAEPGDDPMAGILLYTAAADSDGTLGGLVELGKPNNLGVIITQALERAKICSSDPICSEHEPAKDRSLHSASCHACGFVSETSCERGNCYLDRALLVKTFDCSNAAFFN